MAWARDRAEESPVVCDLSEIDCASRVQAVGSLGSSMAWFLIKMQMVCLNFSVLVWRLGLGNVQLSRV